MTPIKTLPRVALVLGLLAASAVNAQPLADADGNGALSKAEAQGLTKARYAMLDSDGNGTVTQEEFTANFMTIFETVDTNSDASITRAEMRNKIRELRQLFGVAG